MELEKTRQAIDTVDEQLSRLFVRRMELIRDAGAIKRGEGMPILDDKREREIIRDKARDLGDEKNSEYVRSFFLELMRLSRLEQNRSRNIYLIGMPGAGKSTFAAKLKMRLNRLAVDTDEVIADRAGMSIKEIFQIEGEAGFREREREVLKLVCSHGSMIVATGGGILTYLDNAALIKNSGVSILLDVPLDTLIKMDMSSRPLIKSTDDITALYYERYAMYRNAADIIIDPANPDALDRAAIFAADRLDLSLELK